MIFSILLLLLIIIIIIILLIIIIITKIIKMETLFGFLNVQL